MKTARLISATAAVAAGLALLSSGGGSLAGWYDASALSGTTITSGELRVEEIATSAVVVGSTIVVEASSRLHVEGDALAADLALDVEGFTPNGSTPPTVEVVTGPTAGRLDASKDAWPVDKMYNGMTVTARIELPVGAARALPGQPRVTWALTQTTPGQGWYSEAVHEVSLAGLWPAVPTFPEVACTPAADGSITLSWAWTGDEPARWEIVERNSPGNNATVVRTINADGRVIYSTTVQTQNDNWLYSVRAVWADGRSQESRPVTRSCSSL